MSLARAFPAHTAAEGDGEARRDVVPHLAVLEQHDVEQVGGPRAGRKLPPGAPRRRRRQRVRSSRSGPTERHGWNRRRRGKRRWSWHPCMAESAAAPPRFNEAVEDFGGARDGSHYRFVTAPDTPGGGVQQRLDQPVRRQRGSAVDRLPPDARAGGSK
jgi:hypothetical protein